MASSLNHAVPAAEQHSLRPSRLRKRSFLLLALVGGGLVVGAVFGGVFGARAVEEKKRRRVPIPVEAVTYSMVTEGLMNAAVVPVPPNLDTRNTDNAATETAATSPVTVTADKAPAGTGIPADEPASVFSYEYWFGEGGIGAVTMFDPMPLVLPPNAVTVPSWQAAYTNGNFRNTGGRVVCSAKTGREVIQMASGNESPCEIILLTNDRFTPYAINKMINITKPKIIVGRPIYSPMLNSTNRIERLFDILPGGRLETRNVILVRGFGRDYGLNGNEVNLAVGTIARVQVGGQFTAVSCMLRERNNTLPGFIDEVRRKIRTPTARNRQIGQFLLVLGGQLTLTNCRSIRFRPFGNGVLNVVAMGRDINVVAGMCTLIGHNSASSSLWSVNYYMSGALAIVMGGVLTFIGGNNIGANLLQVQNGVMVNFGTFAGVLVTVGYGYTTVKFLLLRNILAQFGTVAGVSIQLAFVRGSATAIQMVAAAGGTHGTVTGVNNRHNGAETSYGISHAFFGVGSSNYVGSGSSFIQAIPKIGTVITNSQSGAGFGSFLGAGTITNSYLPNYSVTVARFNAGAASDVFVGAGWHSNINCTRYSYQVANCFVGVGNQVFVGFGGAVFIRSYSQSARVVDYKYPTIFTYTVGGTGVRSSGAKGQNLVMTKGGVTRYIYNKTTHQVTQLSETHAQWTASPTSPGGGKFSRRKALVPEKRAVQAEDTANVPATMASWLKTIIDATGGLDPSLENKIVVLQSTITERKIVRPPHPSHFRSRRLKERFGGYPKILADGLVDMEHGGESVVTPGLISANNSACFLCNVGPGESADHIGGPGQCEVKDVCGNSSNPGDIYAQAQAATTTNILPPASYMSMPKFDEDGSPISTSTWMLWHELVVYCHSTDPTTDDNSITSNCLSQQYIKEVIKGYIMMDSTKNEYQMAVSDGGIHGAVDAFPDPTMDDLKVAITPQWNPDCRGWTKYDIRLLANDPVVEQHILDIFEGFVEDSTDLQTTIIANADPSADLQPCGITITEKGEQRYPPASAMPAFRPSQKMTLGPDVMIADDISIEPVKRLSPGKTYTVFVQNFPKGFTINLKLMDGLVKTGPVVATIASFDDDGLSEVRWTVPTNLDVNGGKYYLKAEIEDIAVLFAFSQVFYFEDGGENM